MRRALLVAVIAALSAGCVPTQTQDVTYFAAKLPPEQAAYYRATYADATWSRRNYGYRGIQLGLIIKPLYDETIEMIEANEKPEAIIGNLQLARLPVESHLVTHSTIWAAAIKGRADFSVAMGLVQLEFTRLGVDDSLSRLESTLASQIRQLSREDFPSTFELYATFSQMTSLAGSPTGSLMSFNTQVSGLKSTFERELALAKLEFTASPSDNATPEP